MSRPRPESKVVRLGFDLGPFLVPGPARKSHRATTSVANSESARHTRVALVARLLTPPHDERRPEAVTRKALTDHDVADAFARRGEARVLEQFSLTRLL